MSGKYSSVMQLGRHSDTMLLRDLQSGYLVVRRIVGEKQAEIYQMLKNIMEPHIPVIYSIIAMEDGRYEIMEEYIQGRTLEEILQEEGCISKPLAVFYITQLCDVLEKVHEVGLIHRDIKPSNIIITSDDRLYLIDFEIARTRKEERDSDTEILGTQGYAAPEQFGFHQTGARADIYSTGILLNKLLTGKMPNECLPNDSIVHVVRQCIQMDTAKRYKSAKVLKRVLRPYLPQDHSRATKVLRHIPGFRSFKIWKMVIAVMVYGYILLILLVSLPFMVAFGGAEDLLYFILDGLICGLLFFFTFDILKIRSSIRWLEKSRGSWFYPVKSVLWVVAGLIIMIVIGAWCVDGICNLIEMYVGNIPK